MSHDDLARYLQERIGVPVTLKITDNRRNMVSFRKDEQGRFFVRVHRIFVEAPRRVWLSLASFCKHPTKSNRAVIGAYIRENDVRIHADAPRKLPEKKRVTRGRFHDLQALFDKLNKLHFRGKCDAAYSWGARSNRRRRRSIRFGSYDRWTNTIRIHPALDEKIVPAYVVEVVLYHEMLHWYIPSQYKNGRNYVHTRLFRQAEKLHPQLDKAERWQKEHLDRLLRS